jgi:uncharacterized repeat protein (TIGR02059 family)
MFGVNSKQKAHNYFIISLVFIMLFSSLGVAFAQPSDTHNHWAGEQISQWVEKGLASGYQDGTFRPNNNITRAEFIALTNRAFGYQELSQVNFTDVSATDWFAGDIAKAKAAGYISGYQDGTIRPNSEISRQEVSAMLARIVKMNDTASEDVLLGYKDQKDIPQWSRQAITAVVNEGLMKGYPDQTFKPGKFITRAEAIVTLDRAFGTNEQKNEPATEIVTYDKAGVYGPTTGVETVEGDITIEAAGVTLQNTKITGNLVLAERIGSGEVTLKNVTVQGDTTIKGGGANSIYLDNCTLPNITVSKDGVRVVAEGNTKVDIVRLESGATLVQTSKTGQTFETVTISKVIPANAKIILDGNFKEVNVEASKVKLEVTSGVVDKLNVAENATDTSIDLAKETKVTTLTLNAAASVTGKGSIDTAIGEVEESTFEKEPANKENEATEGRGTGSGDGGGVKPIIFEGAEVLGKDSTTPTIRLRFSNGLRDNYQQGVQNEYKITLHEGSANGPEIDAYVYMKNKPSSGEDTEKRYMYLSPNEDLKSGKRYVIVIDASFQANNGNTLGVDKEFEFNIKGSGGGSGGGNNNDNNNASAPEYVSSEVTSQGDVSISFNKEMADPTGLEALFIVKVNDEVAEIMVVEPTNNAKKIKLVLKEKIAAGQNVTIAYTKGEGEAAQLKAADGKVLDTFADKTVVNNIPEVITVPKFESSEVTSKGDVSITFSKEMALPTGLEGQFTVQVNDVAAGITAVQLTDDPKKIKLVLKEKIVAGQNVTVAYTKGEDETKQLKSTDGVALESFDAKTVTNNITVPTPTTFSAEVTSKGDISISYDKAIVIPTDNMSAVCSQFVVKVDGTEVAVTKVENTNTVGKIKLVLAEQIKGEYVVTVSYTKDKTDVTVQLKTTDGEALKSFAEITLPYPTKEE